MGINIEFNTDDISAPELDALAALIASLSGRRPGGASLLAVAGIGTDADRPKVDVVVNSAALAEAVEDLGPAVVAPPPPAVEAPAASAAEWLLAAEAERVAAEGVTLDTTGIPWDARIHVSTKSTNKNGSWKKLRNIDDAKFAEISAQLKAVMAAPVPAVVAAFGEPTPGPLTIAADNVDTGSVALAVDDASKVAPPPPATEAVAAPAVGMTEFARVMRMVAAKQTAGTVSTEMVAQICGQLGLTGVRDLGSRPDMIPAFEAMLP